MYEFIRWINEPAICGGKSLGHKVAHVIGIGNPLICVANYINASEDNEESSSNE